MIKLLILLLFVVSCGQSNKSAQTFIEEEFDEAVEVGGLTFDMNQTLVTNLDLDSFIIPSSYQNDTIKFSISIINKNLHSVSLSLSSDDPNFNISHNCQSVLPRRTCIVVIKNNVKQVGSYQSSFILQGKMIHFSMNILPSPVVAVQPLSLSSSSLSIDKTTTLVIKNNSVVPTSLTIDLMTSNLDFSITGACPQQLLGRRSCALLISKKDNSTNGSQKTLRLIHKM